MANVNLLTHQAKVIQSELMYYYPTLRSPANNSIYLASIYCFLGKVDPWTDNNNPPAPTQDQKSIKNIFKNMFVIKQIFSNGISPVINRIDWTANTVYDYYQDTVDMFATDNNNNPIYTFYVKNRYDQVFKCLWNNNSSPSNPQYSTVEPFFQPGTYGTNGIFQSTDGYKWKYMFTVDSGLKVSFMDDFWIPLAPGAYAPGAENPAIGAGDVEVINVTNGGSGYDPANAAITVTVTGDGTGATGTAVVSGGILTDIVVTNTGSNYTYANVSITSTIGSGATAIAPVSPIGGHGADLTSELGAVYNMLVCEFNGSENGNIPTNISYDQIGLLIDPSDYVSNPNPSTGTIYPLSTNISVASGFGAFTFDEKVYQGSYNNQTFSGTVLTFDQVNNVLYLINTSGTINTNAPIYGVTSTTTRTVLNYSTPNIVPYSGYITYVENRSPVQRSSDGIEQFKFVLGY